MQNDKKKMNNQVDTQKLKELFRSNKIKKDIIDHMLNTGQITTSDYLYIIWE